MKKVLSNEVENGGRSPKQSDVKLFPVLLIVFGAIVVIVVVLLLI